MNVEIGKEAAQFPEKEYINGIFFAVRDGMTAPQHSNNSRRAGGRGRRSGGRNSAGRNSGGQRGFYMPLTPGGQLQRSQLATLVAKQIPAQNFLPNTQSCTNMCNY